MSSRSDNAMIEGSRGLRGTLPKLGRLLRRLLTPPLAVKWTLAIASLLIAGMGMLGWYLIGQQEVAFERSSARLGRVLTEQLARSAGEPLLADDTFMLESLAHRQLDDELVVGVGIYDLNGTPRAVAGLIPEPTLLTPLLAQADSAQSLSTQWSLQAENGMPVAATPYLSPIRFKDVLAGYVLLSLNRLQLERDRRALIQILGLGTVVLIVVVGGMAFPLARWMSQPIRRLALTGGLAEGAWPLPALPNQPGDELEQLARQISLLSQDAEGKRLVEDALYRYLSPGVARSVLTRPEGLDLGGRSIRGSVLFCDIVDFTQLSRRMSPEQVGALVNDYFGCFARAGSFCQGTVDKFIGDCVMILFGVPEPDEQHALHAIVCGQAIMRLVEQVNGRRRAAGLPTVQFRVAINSGLMLAGNLGSRERMEFTVVGNSVNLASRLCEQGPSGQLVVTPDTLAEPGVVEQVSAQSLPELDLKGYDRPMSPYLIVATSHDLERQIQACVETATAAGNLRETA